MDIAVNNPTAIDAAADTDLSPGALYVRNVPDLHQLTLGLFYREVMGKLLRYAAREKVSTGSWSIDMLGDYAALLDGCDGRDEDHKTWLLRHGPDLITYIDLVDGWANLITAGKDQTEVEATCAAVADQIATKGYSPVIPITFWALDPEKWPRAMMRKLETPGWKDVSDNYDPSVAAGMEKLFALDSCPKERMILWHGEPGTGKTHALRALVNEWQSWCDVAFITDPERFVGGSPTYLFQVANFTGGRTAAESRRRSKLIILEDAGELMTMEARVATGQGLSRLLNLTDGLMGQGLNVMVLITTNEALSSMHPAVVRPGRCLCEMEFGAHSVESANRWLEEKGSPVRVDRPTPLATLYAIASGKIGG